MKKNRSKPAKSPHLQAIQHIRDIHGVSETAALYFISEWMSNHYVIATPTCFAMIKEIDRSHPPSRIWSARGHYNRGNPDTWLFYFAAGDFKEAWEHLPHLHDYVLWHRSKKDKTYLLPITTFWRRFVNHGKLQFSETPASTPAST